MPDELVGDEVVDAELDEDLEDFEGDGEELDSDDGDAPDEEPTAEEQRLLDLEAYGDHLVTVTVDGEERLVPLSEARAAYMRQADYTRKTQEIAAQRQTVQRAQGLLAALGRDPQGTLDALAQHYGVAFGRPAAPAAGAEDTDGELSPLEQRLAAIEAGFKAQQSEKAAAALDAMMSQAESLLGDDFDPDEVLSRALQENVSADKAARLIYADKVAERHLAEKQLAAAKAAEDAKRAARKRGVAAVSGGRTPKGAGASETIDESQMTTEQLFYALKEGRLKR